MPLKEARKEPMMTQKQLAEKLGVDPAYISHIERSQITPSVNVFFRIVDALGYSIQLVRN